MPSHDSVLPETEDRRCPACRHARIALAGHVTVAQGMIKEKLQCEVCGSRFVFVRRGGRPTHAPRATGPIVPERPGQSLGSGP
jgi:DNA-directed RNA polymerase subunit RPC12/RpoP